MLQLRDTLSKNEWDEFINKHAPGALFQTWDWGEVEVREGHKLWRLGVYEAGRLIAVSSVALVDARRGRFLHVRQGPVLVSYGRDDVWRFLLSYFQGLAKKQSAWFVRMGPRVSREKEALALRLHTLGLQPSPVHHMDAELCWVLDLDKDEQTLFSNMRKTTRYEIRKAEKNKIRIVRSTNTQNLSEFFTLYAQTSRRHGFVPHTGIAAEFDVFVKNGNAVLYLGYYKKRIVAAAVIVYLHGQAIYRHGASVPVDVPVTHLLQWTAIRDAKNRGIKVYNFWGIAPGDRPNHPWRGITVFKKGFGGRSEEYLHAHDYPISPLYWFSWCVDTARRIRKGYA